MPVENIPIMVKCRNCKRSIWEPATKVLIRLILGVAAIHFFTVAAVFSVLTYRHQQMRLAALLGMTVGMYILWIFIGGIIAWRFGDLIQRWGDRHPSFWLLRFFLSCIALCMTEEAITTLMTNLAPFFGVRLGQVYITASSNYWDVILGHSLIVIAPTFLAWAFLLKYYQFQPSTVLVLFGLTGTLMEMIYGGFMQMAQTGMWVLVYGLMIYLPACSAPSNRPGRIPRLAHCILAVLLPFAFMPLCIPILFVIRMLRPSVAFQFPPVDLQGA